MCMAHASLTTLINRLGAYDAFQTNRQGIYLSNLANWVTEFFEVVPISMMSEGHFKRLAHSEKTMVVT